MLAEVLIENLVSQMSSNVLKIIVRAVFNKYIKYISSRGDTRNANLYASVIRNQFSAELNQAASALRCCLNENFYDLAIRRLDFLSRRLFFIWPCITRSLFKAAGHVHHGSLHSADDKRHQHACVLSDDFADRHLSSVSRATSISRSKEI